MRKVLLASLVLILLAFFCVSCGNDSKPIVPPQVNAVGFLREVAGQNFILTPILGKFVTTGGNTQFTTTVVKDPNTGETLEAEIYSIILSADGKKATFDMYGGTADNPQFQWDIFVANADGTGLVQVTNDEIGDSMPQLSPDGSKVIYTAYFCDGFCGNHLVTRKVDGTTPQEIPLPAGAEDAWAPTYSPDGSKIAVEVWGYNETVGEFDGMFVMNADGTNPQMLTNPWATADAWDETPSFTKAGNQIIFSREDYSGETFTEHIYIMNVDGTNVTPLTSGTTINGDPLVLGDRLLFNSNRDNLSSPRGTGFELYTMNTDGSGVTRLTNNTLYDGFAGEYYEPELSVAQHRQHNQAKKLHH